MANEPTPAPTSAPKWSTVAPTSGAAGTTPLSISAPAWTGRSDRTESIVVSTTDGSPQVTQSITVTQSSVGLILTKGDAPGTISKSGGSVLVEGTSNLSSLTFAENSDHFSVSNLQISTDNGNSWTTITSGSAIADDPGTRAAYQWRCTVTATANTTVSARSATVTVSQASTSKSVTVTVSQVAGDATLTTDKTSVTIPAAGTAQTVTVTSNTTFSVS